MANATSMSNLCSHAIRCWGDDVVKLAMGVKSVHEAREILKDRGNLRNSSIRTAFQKAGKQDVTYPDRLLTNLEVQVNHVKWVCESSHLFAIAGDKGYHRNMKSGPGQAHTFIPKPATVSQDVRTVFLGACEKISWLLRVCLHLERKVCHLTYPLEPQRLAPFRNRLLDITKPLPVYGRDCTV